MTDASIPAPSLILGTAGHIDHGKSTLIRALTGTDPDRLAEEKRRGITIELGFAQLALPDGRTMGVVDVPGHERFVRQMIAGATGIDVALLCIAADDGVMPQTVEHLHVLELLGVRTMIVALTKSDLVDAEWAEFMRDEIRARLAETPYASAPIIPVSANDGTGLDELKQAISDACGKTASVHDADGAPARLPIDRAFTIKGSGTVVTGTLWSGTVNVDDELELLPVGRRVRVRSVQEHGASVQTAAAGSRTALNLAGVGTDEVRPGMFLATPGAIEPTDRFDAWFTYLGSARNDNPFVSGTTVRVAHGTSEIPGRVLLMDGASKLEPGVSTLVQVRLEETLPLARGDRFVARTFSPVEVVAGGGILLCHPRRRTTLSSEERAMLGALRDGNDDDAIDACIAGEDGIVSATSISHACGIAPAACAQRLQRLADDGKLDALRAPKAKEPLYGNPARISSLCSSVENALMKYHTLNPEKTGVGKTELARLAGKGLDGDAFDAILDRLSSEGRVILDGGEVSHPKAGAGAKKQEEQARGTLKEALDSAGMTPPTIAALAQEHGLSTQLAHKALGYLEEQGLARRVGDYYFSTVAMEKAEETVVSHLTINGPSSAADLKDALGVTRKHAIPLLEYMDTRGITRRDGDLRRLP